MAESGINRNSRRCKSSGGKSGTPHSLGHGTGSNLRADAARRNEAECESFRPVASPQAAAKANPRERRDSRPGPPSPPELERPNLCPSGEGNMSADNHTPPTGFDGRCTEEEVPITLPRWESLRSLSRRQRGGMRIGSCGDMPEVPAHAGPNLRTRPIRHCRNGRCCAPGSRMGSW